MSTFVYSFRQEFAAAISRGEKAQTCRPHRKDGRVPKPGDAIKLYTGMRTITCRHLGDSVVTECFPLYIDLPEHVFVIASERLGVSESRAFARLDGFESAAAMVNWFVETYREKNPEIFHGYCVRWEPLHKE